MRAPQPLASGALPGPGHDAGQYLIHSPPSASSHLNKLLLDSSVFSRDNGDLATFSMRTFCMVVVLNAVIGGGHDGGGPWGEWGLMMISGYVHKSYRRALNAYRLMVMVERKRE